MIMQGGKDQCKIFHVNQNEKHLYNAKCQTRRRLTQRMRTSMPRREMFRSQIL